MDFRTTEGDQEERAEYEIAFPPARTSEPRPQQSYAVGLRPGLIPPAIPASMSITTALRILLGAPSTTSLESRGSTSVSSPNSNSSASRPPSSGNLLGYNGGYGGTQTIQDVRLPHVDRAQETSEIARFERAMQHLSESLFQRAAVYTPPDRHAYYSGPQAAQNVASSRRTAEDSEQDYERLLMRGNRLYYFLRKYSPSAVQVDAADGPPAHQDFFHRALYESVRCEVNFSADSVQTVILRSLTMGFGPDFENALLISERTQGMEGFAFSHYMSEYINQLCDWLFVCLYVEMDIRADPNLEVTVWDVVNMLPLINELKEEWKVQTSLHLELKHITHVIEIFRICLRRPLFAFDTQKALDISKILRNEFTITETMTRAAPRWVQPTETMKDGGKVIRRLRRMLRDSTQPQSWAWAMILGPLIEYHTGLSHTVFTSRRF